MKHLLVALAVAMLSLLLPAQPAFAASDPRTEPETRPAPSDPATNDTTLGDVTVEALRNREAVARRIDAFVSATVALNPDDSVARWQVPLCPAVIGLSMDAGTLMFDRVSRIAHDVGIPLAAPDCTPNLLIAISRDPEALMRSWLRLNPRLLNRDRGVAATERTISTPAPVRVFHNACSIPVVMTENFGTRVRGACGAPAEIGSKLRRSVARAILSAIVLVDLRRIEGVDIGALSDHVAMRTLAQIRVDAAVADTPTILRLFDPGAPAEHGALSEWDRAFLKSLYGADPGNVAQIGQIKRLMALELN